MAESISPRGIYSFCQHVIWTERGPGDAYHFLKHDVDKSVIWQRDWELHHIHRNKRTLSSVEVADWFVEGDPPLVFLWVFVFVLQRGETSRNLPCVRVPIRFSVSIGISIPISIGSGLGPGL